VPSRRKMGPYGMALMTQQTPSEETNGIEEPPHPTTQDVGEVASRVLANLETHCLALVLEPGLEILDPAALGQPIRDHLRNDCHYQARGGNNCCGGCNPRCPPNHDRPCPRSARSVSLPPTSMNCHGKMPPSRPRIRVASRRPAMLHQKNDTGLANLCALISCCTRRCRRCEADLVTRAVATL
jgi:hypothetical protein